MWVLEQLPITEACIAQLHEILDGLVTAFSSRATLTQL